MATTELPRFTLQDADEFRRRTRGGNEFIAMLVTILTPLASLRVTVTLLALSLFLVLAGTLAQIDYDVWKVVHDYFRTWIAWIELKVFFPRAWDVGTFRFPFPGGKLLGLLLAINLVAAHGLRFKVTARGGRLWAGLALVALGAYVTYAVIASGANTAIESELTESFTNGLWHAMRATLGGIALALAYVMALTRKRAVNSDGVWLWWFGAVTAALLLGLSIWLFANPDVRLDPAGLRILWQLAKATSSSLVLGAGCWALFGKRGGVVLLHSGIALLMFGELYTAERVGEAQMRIVEGQTANHAEDIRSFELAVTDVSDPKVDRSTVIPQGLINAAAKSGEVIDDEALPFAIRVVELMPNATTRRLQPGETPTATAGLGQLRTAKRLATGTGVSMEQTPDAPAAYVELLPKGAKATPGEPADDSLGVYMLSPLQSNEVLEFDGKPYNLALRFTRVPKDYSITLRKFRFDTYEGSTTPKNFESEVTLRDPAHNVDVELSTSMNNPIRYAGETIYQSGYDPNNLKSTTLQVVSNAGWMIPYVACMIIAAGMLLHFTQAIIRFVYRREDEARKNTVGKEAAERMTGRRLTLSEWRRKEVWIPALVTLLAVGYVVGRAMPPREQATEMKIHEFAKLPVAYGGRTQPMDSLASNALRTLSGKETYEDASFKKRQPAIRWLLDLVTRKPVLIGGKRVPAFLDHKVIKVENLDVLQALKLKPRHGFRYSIAEITRQEGALDQQAALAASLPKDERNLTQRKFLELNSRVMSMVLLMEAFAEPDIAGTTQDEVVNSFQKTVDRIGKLNSASAARPVPPLTPEATWRTMLEAETDTLIAKASSKGTVDDAAEGLRKVLAAYAADEPQQFNTAVEEYRDIVVDRAIAENRFEDSAAVTGVKSQRKPAERLWVDRVDFEAYFNHFSPFTLCIALYIAAFVFAVMAWLGWPEGFNRTANWLLWFTFALHTFGLICRIYISGRPPITNLYSSAVFIGWAAVFFALLFEVIYKLGVGNILAAALGFPTMIIAYYLTMDNDGDTIGVMQAVLDTNFWLATHVVCITLGYATTLLAGALGILTILLGFCGGRLDDYQRRQLTRMTYGTICFAIFFSFIGTILGGLWADDSWGRFWGWDPKENGALMIVIWNAIVLHARWGKMVGERGLASLAVLGNIVTAWSWFGVNEMGVGLHAYGFTEGRSFWLALFMLSQLGVVAVAYVWPLIVGTTGRRSGATPA